MLCFNTSYVSVQDELEVVNSIKKYSFNTSYVSVQVSLYKNIDADLFLFQYILCFGSSLKVTANSWTVGAFQYILCFGSRQLQAANCQKKHKVSIHPMFRFK